MDMEIGILFLSFECFWINEIIVVRIPLILSHIFHAEK